MVAITQATLSIDFSSMNAIEFLLKFLWQLLPQV